MGKPVHPAAVHFPIAFLTLSFGLDIANQLYQTNRLPSWAERNLPISADMTRASYFLLSAGLLTAIPTLITGILEAGALMSKQSSIWESDQNGKTKTMQPKIRALFAHALFNDIVMATSTFIWYRKRANAAKSLAGKIGVPVGVAAYQPEFWMVATEVPIMMLMFTAANLGGILTYNYGAGFSAAGGSTRKTQ